MVMRSLTSAEIQAMQLIILFCIIKIYFILETNAKPIVLLIFLLLSDFYQA